MSHVYEDLGIRGFDSRLNLIREGSNPKKSRESPRSLASRDLGMRDLGVRISHACPAGGCARHSRIPLRIGRRGFSASVAGIVDPHGKLPPQISQGGGAFLTSI